MFVRFLCCMLCPSLSYSFLCQHASYWKVKPISLVREKRHFAWSFDAVYGMKWPISHVESILSLLYDSTKRLATTLSVALIST